MQVMKAASVLQSGRPDDKQLAEINRQAKSTLTADEVYVFAVRLCDNQLDRDGEKFSDGAIRELAPMFVGKTGILDHAWSAENQLGRIFRTEVVQEPDVLWIKAWVYMLRSDKTQGLIREIEAGIKKEVSVGCAMGRTVCSVCGEDFGSCGHRKGQVYGGQVCAAVLCDPVDAYEFSFVAVPAQRDAGVVKAASRDKVKLAALEKEAEYGRMYRKMLQQDIVKMGLSLELGLEEDLLKKLARVMDMEQLVAVQATFSEKMAAKFPPMAQLSGRSTTEKKPDSAFLI